MSRAEHMDRIGDPGHCDECGDPLTVSDVDLDAEGKPRRVWYERCTACLLHGEPCMKCGERGGDPDDCRSATCLSNAADAAEYLMEDR